MKHRRPTNVSFLTSVVALLLGTINGLAAGSNVLRGSIDSYVDGIQAEDYIVMQMEIEWGMKEMRRYRSHKGDFPTRQESKPSASKRGRSHNKMSSGEQSKPDWFKKSSNTSLQSETVTENQGFHKAGASPPSKRTEGSTRLKRATTDVDVNDTMNLAIDLKAAIRTVEDYWNFLISMF